MSSAVTTQVTDLQNYVNGAWRRSTATEYVDVTNPATTEVLARTPLSTSADVDAAVQAAADAFPAWRRTPPGERVQYLFKLKNLLEENLDDLARVITLENGKTFAEARAELRRAIENVEVACGIPMMMQGYNLEDVTPGVDEMQIRQPLGVVAAIVPFNSFGKNRPAQRSRKSRQRRKRSGKRALRPSASARHQFCRFDPRCQTCLHALRGQRQTHAVPRRREESRHRFARCGHGARHANHKR